MVVSAAGDHTEGVHSTAPIVTDVRLIKPPAGGVAAVVDPPIISKGIQHEPSRHVTKSLSGMPRWSADTVEASDKNGESRIVIGAQSVLRPDHTVASVFEDPVPAGQVVEMPKAQRRTDEIACAQ